MMKIRNITMLLFEKFDEEDDLSPMIEFFKYEMEKTWEKSLDKENGIVKRK